MAFGKLSVKNSLHSGVNRREFLGSAMAITVAGVFSGAAAATDVRSPGALVLRKPAETHLDFQSRFCGIRFSRDSCAFSVFSIDALGSGQLHLRPLLPNSESEPRSDFAQLAPAVFTYRAPDQSANAPPLWTITCREKTLRLESRFIVGQRLAPPFTLRLNQSANHATLLGLMNPGERTVQLPCVMHCPDEGSVRIHCSVRSMRLGYDARRRVRPKFVEITFPAATVEHPMVVYDLEVAAIYPALPGIEKDPRFDGFRRNFLNIFQVNPRLHMLANNSSSDACSFTVFKYAEVARRTPALVGNLTALDLLRMTLEQYLGGAKGYGQTGYPTAAQRDADLVPWTAPWSSLDTNPSLLIAACFYVEGTRDWKWARTYYDTLLNWGHEMLAADTNGNGLIEYPATGNSGERPTPDRRPANWWDTITFGHEDAYSNALAYRAATLLAAMARKLSHPQDAAWFATCAAKMRAAYVPTFLNPESGVLAGWKSADGKLHDYAFLFVNGVAITYGLVDHPVANRIMDRLLQKMAQVGYTTFQYGLPGNLIPVRKADYVKHEPGKDKSGTGEPELEDGSDSFQLYENGGATPSHAYWTIKALYTLGRVEEARRIFYPMLETYARGGFQGFDANGRSVDWRDWHGGGHGYEGFLVDSYLPLLAVFDDRQEISSNR